MAPKGKTQRTKVDVARPDRSARPDCASRTAEAKKITKKSDSETQKAVKKDRLPASRKRAADFLDDSDDEMARPTTSLGEGKVADDASGSSADEQDQTAALLQGFESSASEESSGDEAFKQGQQIPKVPSTKKTQDQLARIKQGEHDEPGVLYVGRIPHGFYEHEMRAYFSQFGDITRLRLSRNRRTGRSKHYAFIEFASAEVAQIVADTMNNYLLFGHILKCQLVPPGKVHEDLWKGANRRFNMVPRNKLQGKQLEKAKPRGEWTKKIEKEAKKRKVMMEKLQAIGYEFELPVLKSVSTVPGPAQPNLLDGAHEGGHAGGDGSAEVALAAEPKESSPKTVTKERVQEVKRRKGRKPSKVSKPQKA